MGSTFSSGRGQRLDRHERHEPYRNGFRRVTVCRIGGNALVSGMTGKSTSGRPRFDRDSIVSQARSSAMKAPTMVNELSRRTGASKPSLYRAFGSEDGPRGRRRPAARPRPILDRSRPTLPFETLDVIAQMMDPSALLWARSPTVDWSRQSWGPPLLPGSKLERSSWWDAYARRLARGQVEGRWMPRFGLFLGTDLPTPNSPPFCADAPGCGAGAGAGTGDVGVSGRAGGVDAHPR